MMTERKIGTPASFPTWEAALGWANRSARWRKVRFQVWKGATGRWLVAPWRPVR